MSDFKLIILLMFSTYLSSIFLNKIKIGRVYGCLIILILNFIVIFNRVYFFWDYNYSVLRTIIYSLSMSIIILPIVYSIYKKF